MRVCVCDSVCVCMCVCVCVCVSVCARVCDGMGEMKMNERARRALQREKSWQQVRYDYAKLVQASERASEREREREREPPTALDSFSGRWGTRISVPTVPRLYG